VSFKREFHISSKSSVCVSVDLTKLLPQSIELVDRGRTFAQQLRYLNFPNSCFACQVPDHHVKDRPHRRVSKSDQTITENSSEKVAEKSQGEPM
jgi:hypothetical protein